MIYVNAGTNSGIPHWLKISLRTLYVFFIVFFIVYADDYFLDENFHFSNIPISLIITAILLAAITLVISIYGAKYDYLTRKLNVEITDDGLWSNYPGVKRNFAWLELEDAKIVNDKMGLSTLEVFWKDQSFVFHPLLIAENDESRRLRFFPSPTEDYQVTSKHFIAYVWELKDGKRLPITLVNSTGYKLLEKYRNDLFKKLKAA